MIGMAFGVCTRAVLRRLQRYGATAEQQIALTLACGYLAFYVANAPCKVSGGLQHVLAAPPCDLSPGS